MKRGFILVMVAMMMLPVFGQKDVKNYIENKGTKAAISWEDLENISLYKDVIKGLGLECVPKIEMSELVGDTIQFEPTVANIKSRRYYLFEYVIPDTLWLKHKKKNPVEGKHYVLLYKYGATYRVVDKKNYVREDFTSYDDIWKDGVSLKFRIDSIDANNKFWATEIESNRQITFPAALTSDFLYVSSKLSAYYKTLIAKEYYFCKYPNRISKEYSKHTISKANIFITNLGYVKIDTDMPQGYTYRTEEQYQKDTATENNYWKEFNTPHHINYYVNKEEVEYDAKYMSAFTEGYVVLLKSAQKIKVGQTIEKGKIVEEAEIVRDESFWFIGIDSICGKEYFMVGHNGKFFYVNKEDVTIDWEDELSDGTIRDYTDNTEILNVYRNLSPEAKKYYAEYMKWYVYGFYKLLVDQLNSVLRPLKSSGLIITDMSLTDGYYSTGLDFSLTNLSNKTIKYIAFTTKGFNAVDDPMETKTVRGIGPIEPGESGSYEFDHVWRTTLVEYHDPISLVITYMDGSTKKFVSKDIDKCFVDIEKVEDMKNYISKPEGMKCGILDSKTGKIEEYPKFVF